MKLTDVGSSPEEVEPYLVDPEWVMQQKHDGARMLAAYGVGGGTALHFLNQNGVPMTFAAAALMLPALHAELKPKIQAIGLLELVLDGEIMPETGVFHVWDVVEAYLDPAGLEAITQGDPYIVRPDSDWLWRNAIIRTVLKSLEGPLLQFSVTARSEAEKRALWANVLAANVEGAVSKHVRSKWVDGVRTKEWVKHKLVKTADVIVTSVQRTFKADGVTLSHGKAELAVAITLNEDPKPYVDAKGKRLSIDEYGYLMAVTPKKAAGFAYAARYLLPVGNASLIGKDLTIDVGSVVEVAYLNFQEAMIQPRILRKRFSKLPEHCSIDQFPEYHRTVVGL